MLKPKTGKKFRRDLEKAKKQRKDIEELGRVMGVLCSERPLDPEHKDHPLKGNWIGRRECHVTPDWLLVYHVIVREKVIYFERLGSHSELFS
jgi:mRNA interferase YafQ